MEGCDIAVHLVAWIVISLKLPQRVLVIFMNRIGAVVNKFNFVIDAVK